MKQYCVLICLVLYVHFNTAEEISSDYYFGPASLRSQEPAGNTCKDALYEQMCFMYCPNDHVCFMWKCMCIDVGVAEKVLMRPILYEKNVPNEEKEAGEPPNFIDLTKISAGNPYSNYYPPEKPDEDYEYLPTPALRHHIAHFCINLDVARECIRKCMPLGKPAFCGKDHVCYCGHKYTNWSPYKKKETDAAAVYSEFKDLYQKYFGQDYPKDGYVSTTNRQVSSSSEE